MLGKNKIDIMEHDCDGIFIKEIIQKLSGEFFKEAILFNGIEETPKKLFGTFYFDKEIPLGLYYKIEDMIRGLLGDSFVRCEHNTTSSSFSLVIHYNSILYSWRRIK